MAEDAARRQGEGGAEAQPPAHAEARRRLVLIAAMLAMFMAAVEATIVATAMPTIVAALGGFRLFSWVFAIYFLGQAVTIPIYGRLADLYGRKRIFLVGATIFLAGSTLCGFSPDMVTLILCRGLQGIGAGAILPIATTIVGDIYPADQRARIQGWLSSIWGVSAVVGPLLGAFLIAHASWALIFWINLPVGIAAMAMLELFLKERQERRPHRIDYAGSLLLMIGTGALMLALTQAASLGAGAAGALLIVALLSLAAFLRHEARTSEPMMPLTLWRQRIIAVGNLGGIVIGAAMMGTAAFLPTYVQGVLGKPPLIAGIALTLLSIGWPAASALSGRLMVTTSYRTTALLGGGFLVLGSVLLCFLVPPRGAVWAGAGALLIGLGMGFCNTTFVVAVQNTVAWQERGIATSLTIFTRMVGQSLGAALFGAVLNLGIEARVGPVGDAIDRLMDPGLRDGLGPAEIERLSAAVAAALHSVYVLDLVIAVVALLLCRQLPAALSARSAAAQR